MTLADLIIVAVVFVVLFATQLEWWRRQRAGWLGSKKGRDVVVHLVDDASYEGRLLEVNHRELVLARVKHISGDAPVELKGDVAIPRNQVRMTQVL